ncbi:MAG: hypothetical protein EZS26_002232 [Candidatus Ordinivivax streblomastigis]|uniref:Uncharacterized protein n=1 Tax=Candidatus Ordinivivax streblomastigis TaxID=2540710 RepID=A0A5M8NZT2_9BACT|nr:MAG: hypothetical protein EZS26_002232 [Candidatus Ordinivivax streblomastigis]
MSQNYCKCKNIFLFLEIFLAKYYFEVLNPLFGVTSTFGRGSTSFALFVQVPPALFLSQVEPAAIGRTRWNLVRTGAFRFQRSSSSFICIIVRNKG